MGCVRGGIVKFPAIAEEHDVLGRGPGEPLWPEVFSRERLEKVRDCHINYYWQALYQQNPVAEGSAEWPEDFFTPDIWFDEWPDHWICRTVALDPSKGVESKFGDYSAFVMVMIADNCAWIDARLEKFNTTQITEMAIDIQRQFQPDWFGVEVNQFQQLLADEICNRCQERRISIPMYSMTNTVNKLVRIRRLTPLLSQHRLKFKRGSRGARLLVEQLRDFPNGDHDDGPDALEMALRLTAELRARIYEESQLPEIIYT